MANHVSVVSCVAASIWALASCSFDTSNSLGSSDSGSVDGAIVDAEIDEIDGNRSDAIPFDASLDAFVEPCVGDLLEFEIKNMGQCDPEIPTVPMILNEGGERYVLDTTNETLSRNGMSFDLTRTVVQQIDGPELLVVSVQGLEISASSTLKVIGQRPLVIVSTSSMSIAGTILVTGTGQQAGPGGNNNPDCESIGSGGSGVTQEDTNGNQGGSGGGGGGYGSSGGKGAKIDDANNGEVETTEGMENGGAILIPLRGGCSGGNGGNNNNGNGGGGGGGGGGVIQLVTKLDFTLSGIVAASGGGGLGANSRRAGGGGGGSGGGILIQAKTTALSGGLLANGGGGGEGNRGGSSANNGANGSPTDITQAAGGSGGSAGGNGGKGAGHGTVGGSTSTSSSEEGQDGNANNAGSSGGGGGGGGSGQIRVELEQ